MRSIAVGTWVIVAEEEVVVEIDCERFSLWPCRSESSSSWSSLAMCSEVYFWISISSADEGRGERD